MPHSYHFGKPEATAFILKNTTKDSKILDVGAGVGTYSDLLKPHGYTMDCIEVYDKYIEAYDLKTKYRKVFCNNILNFDVSEYDFVILGDVLEHLTIAEAKSVLSRCKNVLVAVPYICPQGGVDFYHNEHHLVNGYEEHKQADLTPSIMLSRYEGLGLIWSNEMYGYFSNIRWAGYYK